MISTPLPSLKSVMAIDRPLPYSANRVFEWIMAFAMLGMALTLVLPGKSLPLAANISEGTLSLFVGIIGTLRCGALFANGRLPFYGARARAVGSMLGALVWLQFLLLLIWSAFNQGTDAVFIPLLLALLGGEIVSVERAVHDAGRPSGTP